MVADLSGSYRDLGRSFADNANVTMEELGEAPVAPKPKKDNEEDKDGQKGFGLTGKLSVTSTGLMRFSMSVKPFPDNTGVVVLIWGDNMMLYSFHQAFVILRTGKWQATRSPSEKPDSADR